MSLLSVRKYEEEFIPLIIKKLGMRSFVDKQTNRWDGDAC